jgi:hypothetical protein
MDKKDIYEHLASIYLDASSKSSKKRKKHKGFPAIFRNLFFVSAVIAVSLGVVLASNLKKRAPFNSQVNLVLLSDAAKINFNFDPAKKEYFRINLNNLSALAYKHLGFAIKKANYADTISLRVEFANTFAEKSEIYLKDIPHKWQEYTLKLSDFKGIRDWSELASLEFAVEEWNTRENHGVVYIDNVRLLN